MPLFREEWRHPLQYNATIALRARDSHAGKRGLLLRGLLLLARSEANTDSLNPITINFNVAQYATDVANELMWALEGLVEEE